MNDLNETQLRSLEVVQSFFAAKERQDLDAVMALFADDVIYRHPLNASGDPSPWFQFDGKEETTAYQRGVIERFSQMRMLDMESFVNPDGSTVFVTARGDYVQAVDQQPYNNLYVFKFVVQNGKITRVDEYANPVTFAKLAGFAIG